MACLAWTSFGRFEPCNKNLAEREEGLQGALSRRALCRVVLQRLPLGTSFVLRTFRAAAICRRFALVTSFPCAWLSASCSFRAVAPCPWPHQLGCRGTLRSAHPGPRDLNSLDRRQWTQLKNRCAGSYRSPREHGVRWFRSQLAHIWSEPLWHHGMYTPPRP